MLNPPPLAPHQHLSHPLVSPEGLPRTSPRPRLQGAEHRLDLLGRPARRRGPSRTDVSPTSMVGGGGGGCSTGPGRSGADVLGMGGSGDLVSITRSWEEWEEWRGRLKENETNHRIRNTGFGFPWAGCSVPHSHTFGMQWDAGGL